MYNKFVCFKYFKIIFQWNFKIILIIFIRQFKWLLQIFEDNSWLYFCVSLITLFPFALPFFKGILLFFTYDVVFFLSLMQCKEIDWNIEFSVLWNGSALRTRLSGRPVCFLTLGFKSSKRKSSKMQKIVIRKYKGFLACGRPKVKE